MCKRAFDDLLVRATCHAQATTVVVIDQHADSRDSTIKLFCTSGFRETLRGGTTLSTAPVAGLTLRDHPWIGYSGIRNGRGRGGKYC
jgi:hypothetical protein